VIASFGRENGYGNVIKISHQGRYSTVYGHLSRLPKVCTVAARVAGEAIGYVGMTGLATGPHLHYEFKSTANSAIRCALPYLMQNLSIIRTESRFNLWLTIWLGA